jgi:hypothetical protein
MTGFLTNLARRGAGIAPTVVPRLPLGSEAPASRPQTTDTSDAPDNPAPVGNAATRDTAKALEVRADAADPFGLQVDRSSWNGPAILRALPDQARVSPEMLPTPSSNALPDARQTFENRPSPVVDPLDPQLRSAARPAPAELAPNTSPVPPSRPVEGTTTAEHDSAGPSTAPVPRIAARSAEPLPPSPRPAEVTSVAQGARPAAGEPAGPAPARPEAPSIRVTIGRVDIRASSPPPAPQRSPSQKDNKGFAELRLSRGHLGRTYV